MWKFADKIVTQSLPNGQCPSSFRTLSGVILISECAVAAGRRTFDRIGNHLNILITAVTLETKEGGFRFGPHHLSGWFGIQTLDARELLEEAARQLSGHIAHQVAVIQRGDEIQSTGSISG